MKRGMIAALLLALGVMPAAAEKDPAAVKADTRIRKVIFSPDDVVIVYGTLGVSSMIVFGETEQIRTVSMGDTVSWEVKPDQTKRYIFLKPLERDATTNMNVVTSSRIYNFQLKSAPPGSKDTVYRVQFVYPDEESDKRLLTTAQNIAAHPLLKNIDWSAVNRNYSYKGSFTNKPSEMFDDGLKTYFEFSGEVPGIFLVKPDRHETLMNYRRDGDYVIVDKVAGQWTLRFGSEATSVFNLRALTPAQAQAAEDDRVRRVEAYEHGSASAEAPSGSGSPLSLFSGFSLSNIFPRSSDGD